MAPFGLSLFGHITGYGFDEDSSIGSLSSSTDSLSTSGAFSIGSNDFTITAIGVTLSQLLTVGFRETGVEVFTPTERAALRLHVCNEDYDLSTSADESLVFQWDTSLDWSPPVMTRTLYLSLPANHLATGEPTITGTAQVGGVLSAEPSGIVDVDGLTGVEFSYQWVRVDADGTSNPADITDATAATYTVTADDVGKKIKVTVSFTDNLSGEEERTSDAYPTSGTVTAPPMPTALVSNLGSASTTAIRLGTAADSKDAVQLFTTGTNPGGYTLTGIEIELQRRGSFGGLSSSHPAVKLHAVTVTGTSVALGTEVATLTASSASVSNGFETYMAPIDTALVGSTTYGVFVEGGGGAVRWDQATTGDEDATPAAGWSIGDQAATRAHGATGGFTLGSDGPGMIRVNGVARSTATNTPPTSAQNSVDTNEDEDYTFSSDDFPFMDMDTDDSLVSVKIVTLPATGKGTLTLSGTAIPPADLPKTVPAGELGNLKYVPPANAASYNNLAPFTFKVNDGTDDSDETYQFNIDVIPVDDPATGKPGIEGTARVGETLTATVGTIADVDGASFEGDTNGVPNAFFSGASTTVQWIRVDGGNESDISGATSETYLLANDDQGKKIKVKVSFEDERGTREGPLTSDAYPTSGTVMAEADTTAPAGALVSNMSAASSTAIRLGAASDSKDGVQLFTTGTNPGGYTLTGIDIHVHRGAGSQQVPAVKVHAVTVTGTSVTLVGTPVATLTTSVTHAGEGPVTYTTSMDAPLDPTTTYGVFVEGGGPGLRWDQATTGAEDATPAAGWSIGDHAATRAHNSTGAFTLGSDGPGKIRVNGVARSTATNAAPTVVTTIPDQAAAAGTAFSYAFPDTTFTDADGDTLTYTATQDDDSALPSWLTFDGASRTFSGTPAAADVGTVSVKVTATDPDADSVSDTFDIVVSAAVMSSCPLPSFGDRRVVWIGEMTVAAIMRNGAVVGHGFSGSGPVGGLTPTQIDTGRNTYTVDGILVSSVGNSDGNLIFSLTGNASTGGRLTDAELAALRLHVCNDELAFSTASYMGASGTYTWAEDFDWSLVSPDKIYLSLPGNKPATGAPAIAGPATVGERLAADATGIADADGLAGVDFTYKWFRVDADGVSNEAEISGATSATYTLTDDDVGKKVKVQVSFTDDLGGEEMRTSATTATVATTNVAPTAADKTVMTGEDRPYTFTAADFSFADTDAADMLASVKIVTVPAAGTLALDGTAVMANGVVTKAQIDADMLVFTPAQDAHGDPYTSFTFKVNDGRVDSTATYTMTIDVTDAPAPVCAAPSFGDRREIWTGTVTVAADEFGGNIIAYGFFEPHVGGLAPKAFTIGSNSYTIYNVRVETEFGDEAGAFIFGLTSNLTSAEASALKLHVCDSAGFGFADADHDSVENYYVLDIALDWSPPVQTRTLYLSLPANHDAMGDPTITGTPRAGQELSADVTGITDVDGLAGVEYSYQWIRVDADGTSNPADITDATAATYTLTAEDVGKKVKVKVGFTDDLSGVEERTSAATDTILGVNTAPVFSPSSVSRSIAENIAAGENVGAAVTATDADPGDTLIYSLGGADMAAFDFVAATGQIRTKSGVTYDHEAKSSYTVTVTATDTGSANAVATVTIDIDDVNEPPDAPATPVVNAVSGSTTGLSVSWAAPANAGKPDIDNYDVQYRLGSSGAWSDGPQDVTGTTATITGLATDTAYQARVRATNAEGGSAWSEPPGSGRTNAPTNNAPVFDPAMPEREIAENTAAGVDVGAPVTATDADPADTLTYTLGGADAASFDFVGTTGQIRTKAGVSYDHEAKSSYTVTVTASDGTATTAAGVTIGITDVDEPPEAPATPVVSPVSGNTSSLSVSWAAPANDGRPAIGGYDLQYRAGDSGPWSDGPQNLPGAITSATITRLTMDTAYQVRVRATNDEGDSGWSEPPGAGRTDAGDTEAPTLIFASVLESGGRLELTYHEALDPGSIPAPGDFTVTVDGQPVAVSGVNISIHSFVVQLILSTAVGHGQTVTVDYTPGANPVQDVDGNDAGPLVAVNVVNDAISPPGAPENFDTAPGDGRVTLSWTAPASDGGADIRRYQYRVRRADHSVWADWSPVLDSSDPGASAADETRVVVSGLSNGTEYAFELRATNHIGPGPAASANETPEREALPPGSDLLVGNFGQPPEDDDAQIYKTRDIAGVFTAGAQGATLDSIEFRLSTILTNATAELPSATLYGASVTGTRVTRGDRVAVLTAEPGAPRAAPEVRTIAFDAPSGTRLAAGATYMVVLSNYTHVSVEFTTYPAEDAGGARGWAIDGLGAGNSSPYSYHSTKSLLMRLNGTLGGATVATAPDAPASLGAAAGDGRVSLTWTAPEGDGGSAIVKYQYRYSAGSRVDPETAWTDVPDGSDTGTSLADERSVSVTGLDNGRQYAFELRAVNGVRGGAAATATATPMAPPRSGFLVSNFGQPADGAAQILTGSKDIVGVFTTGARGGTLASIEFRLDSRTPDVAQLPSATLYRASVTGTRATSGTRVATLTAAPGSPRPAASAKAIVFTASGGARLEAGATYMVVLEGSSGYVGVQYTNASAQDAGGASGWTIDGIGSGNASPYSYQTNSSLLMSVNGTSATAQRAVAGQDDEEEEKEKEKAATDEQQEEEPEEQEPATTPAPDRGITLSTSSSSAIEGEAVTIRARRAGPTDSGTSVTVQVSDSAMGSAWPINLRFRSGEATATAEVAIGFDGARPASRTVTVSLASVKAPYSVGSPSSVTFNVTDRDAALSVHDASVNEGPGATLAFAVTLDRKRDRTVLVRYATADGTATQGEDYTGVSGTLRFTPGETSKTVSVPVLDDAHDEGTETLTLKLSSARRAVIDDATAVGTIVNSDLMPDAWLSRFGRAASDQVVQSIGRRLEGGARESHVTVLGWRVDTLFESWRSERDGRDPRADAPGGEPEGSLRAPDGRIGAPGAITAATRGAGALPGPGAAAAAFDGALTPGSSPMQGGGFQNPAGASPAGASPAGANPAPGAPGNRWLGLMERLLMSLGPNGGEAIGTPGLRDMVMGSSFYYGLSPDAGPLRGMNRLTAWGESASTRFSGAEDKLSLDGEVNTAIVGADGEWGRWLAGLALSYSEGEGGYRQDSAMGGAVSSTLSGVNPYARYRLNDRASFWGTLGYGSGQLTLSPDGAESSLQTDMTNAMAAFGGRGVLSMRAGEAGRFELALRSDAMLTDTVSDAVLGLAAGEGATSRIRLILEGTGAVPAFGGVVAPRVEAGLRYDGGDAETGAGLEVGGGLAYNKARLTVQVDGRVLLTHRDRDYEEWGYSLSLAYQPGEDGRGLRYQAGSQWGATQSGVQSLWLLQNAGGLRSGAAASNGQRYTGELGYGFGVRRLWYPYVGAESGDGSSQALRFGLKLNAGSALEAGVEIGRRAHLSGKMENDIRLRWQARW